MMAGVLCKSQDPAEAGLEVAKAEGLLKYRHVQPGDRGVQLRGTGITGREHQLGNEIRTIGEQPFEQLNAIHTRHPDIGDDCGV